MEEQVNMKVETLREDGFGEEKYFQCFVAENQENDSSKLIGYVLYYYIYSTWEGKCIYMEDLYVSPAYRGRGIGSRLMGSVCKVAVEKKCARVHFAVLAWNKSSIDYYKRQGAVNLTETEDWHLFRLVGSAIDKMAAKADV
ncbi:thialysine N-epsilon-acetyltransferase-like isoform X2 [Ostrea edulis]|nr:thialysine N-epsilon-acetyltransferase-like isoform X2 [Ostrea edulis]XP_056004572.1 thialysine N-epsilon-acetyltransferase-like isoform X2 [Ostrea edulis]